MEPILEAENLECVFTDHGRFTAVADVSFSLMPGERLAIIGESGSGKTTVANMLSMLKRPTAGTIRLEGEDITRMKGSQLRAVYRKLQMVFQSPIESFDPRRRLGEGIAESLINAGMARKEAEAESKKFLIQCGLTEDFWEKFPHEVSGGQCQRAAIARALAIRPKVLILDEATSALDVTIQQELLELLDRLQAEYGLSYIFISHDLALVQNFCHRVLVMHQGKIVEEGTPDQVIRNPEDPYTVTLVNSILS